MTSGKDVTWLVRSYYKDGVFVTSTCIDPETCRLKLLRIADIAKVKILEFKYSRKIGSTHITVANRI